MLVLDEATSNLDLQSETKIEAALDVLLEDRTAVLIAHRLSTAMRADRIVVVDDGRIVEVGHPRRAGGPGRSLRRDVRDLGPPVRRRRTPLTSPAPCGLPAGPTWGRTWQGQLAFGAPSGPDIQRRSGHGILDKVKAQATVLADKAQTGVQQGQTKLAEMQSNKQADHMLRELGAYVFLSERGRNQPDSEQKVAALMAQLDALEAAGTPITLSPDQTQLPSADAVPQAGTIPQDGSGAPGGPHPPGRRRRRRLPRRRPRRCRRPAAACPRPVASSRSPAGVFPASSRPGRGQASNSGSMRAADRKARAVVDR